MAQLILPGTAAPGDVLTGKNFSGGTNYGTAGTMPNNGAVTINPSNAAQTVAAGYHNGGGSVAAVPVPAANVLTGTTIAGTAGTMPNNAAVTITPSNAAQTIAAGYHNGSGSVPAVTVPAGNVLTGTTIAGTAGTMPDRGAVTITPSTVNQAILAGYHSGAGSVIGDPDLIAANILLNKNIFNVIGTLQPKVSATGTTPTDASGNFSVTGLSFTPTLVIAESASGSNFTRVVYYVGLSANLNNVSIQAAPSNRAIWSTTPVWTVSAGAFSCIGTPLYTSNTATWIAYG